MSDWDITNSAVRQVFTNTDAAAESLATALSGSSDGTVKGIGGAADDMVTYTQSPLIGSALEGFFEDRRAGTMSVFNRIKGVLAGTSEAVTDILAGHGQMAEAILAQIQQACDNGDFTGLIPPDR